MSKAVSEILGYMYIFGIVMAVLAIVFVQVNTMTEDMKRSVMSQSLEQSFKKIQYIIHSVSFGEVPSQAVEIELQGGTLTLDKSDPEFIVAFVNYTETNPSNLPCGRVPNSVPLCINLSTGRLYTACTHTGYNFSACTLNHTIGKIVYRYKDWFLTLEAGSVFSKYSNQDYSKLLYEPRILYNATLSTPGKRFLVMTIPLLDGELSIGGSGRFRFVLNEGNSNVSLISVSNLGQDFNDAYVILRGTENKDAWCRFFERSGDVFNTTLDDTKTSYRRCSNSENAMASIKLSNVHEIIVIFRQVLFST
ncbi:MULTISPECIES: hypothetical protein [Archaeoglobus]|jgi:hypothetical protein|uniref:Uncharacterized protein AF_0758 n=2 Tax=Archaeoglobus fulgidus TaxID=2234 RepID=Y758_ARCFU|nr:MULTISPECIES: hypothetical protein [Archaeoglobus]O29500.1 RecName: Full=Uncharacterized protein AF_0758; Flags: Precursor [Archaeoglobus fulgidus DSM 4304]AAB90487.1 predicted coding region AF_0758 [Archaeoglobus fulgidus DSM 4304]KUJ93529.1 MAG: hypothetical protein XD40_1306 [Archaeoglobus fulgidus]KUK07128.1 MAG: Uncharacterized protein XD48_0667 [Archaeoglobus fulgidus]MDI3496859.1 hypothetical protein [Archaeoglobus sp.]